MRRVIAVLAGTLALGVGVQNAQAHPSRAEVVREALQEVQAAASMHTPTGFDAHVIRVSRHYKAHWRKAWSVFSYLDGRGRTFSCPVVTKHEETGTFFVHQFNCFRVQAATLPRVSASQSGPPTPNPSAQTAAQRLVGSLYRSCRNVRKVVVQGVFPVGFTGMCLTTPTWEYILPSCHYEYPGTKENPSVVLRTMCTGWIMWQTTDWTMEGPCFKWVREKVYRGGQPPNGTVITAFRRGYSYIKSDGSVALRLLPWKDCKPRPAPTNT
jgi:hypothetical protein